MSHEIRTPTAAILGFSDVALGNSSDSRNIEGLKTIQQNGEYLLGITNDILHISKLESGKTEVAQIECSAIHVLADVVSLMLVGAAARGLPLSLKFDGSIPSTIRCERLSRLATGICHRKCRNAYCGFPAVTIRSRVKKFTGRLDGAATRSPRPRLLPSQSQAKARPTYNRTG